MGARLPRRKAIWRRAADLLGQVLELAPVYATAWFALGEVREPLGDRDGAIAAFERRATPIRRSPRRRAASARGSARQPTLP